MIVEVSSYPKCGNTWMRFIIATFFGIDLHLGIPDIHQQKEKTRDLIQFVEFNGIRAGFYKSHITDATSINPNKIVCVYRHPLDVFLSSLNYFYITDNRSKFEGHEPLSVDELYKTGRLDIYFAEYLENVGASYYGCLLGRLSNYFDYLDAALDNPKVISVKYEDMYDNLEPTISELIKELFQTNDFKLRPSLFASVNSKTKDSGDSFYWKAKKENYLDYLTDKQIQEFKHRYRKQLMNIGY